MRYTIKEGNYANMGVEKRENNYIFTFEGEKEDKCCIVIFDKDIEEERRLFYVGMTRAKTRLSIYSVKSINDKNASISRFVQETKQKKENALKKEP